MAICAYDIFEDGTTRAVTDTSLIGGGVYRWWHFDLSDPNLKEWAERELEPIPASALLQSETRPRCDRYQDGLILNLRGVNLNAGEAADQMVSIRMWATQDVLITVRLRKVFAIDAIRQEVEDQAPPKTVASFLTRLIDGLTYRIQDQIGSIVKITEFYEADLEDASTPTPKELPETRRTVIKLLRYLEPQRAAVSKLALSDAPMISDQDAMQLRELANRTTIAVEELDAMQERLVTVQQEHDLSAAARQTHHSYILSVVAAVFLPLGFLTGLFGVNIGGMPGLESPVAFWLLCLSMIMIGLALFGMIKWLKWL